MHTAHPTPLLPTEQNRPEQTRTEQNRITLSRDAHVNRVYTDKLYIVQQGSVCRHASPRQALRAVPKQRGDADHPALPHAHARQEQIPSWGELPLGLFPEHKEEGGVSTSPGHLLPVNLSRWTKREPGVSCVLVRDAWCGRSFMRLWKSLENYQSCELDYENPPVRYCSYCCSCKLSDSLGFPVYGRL